MKGGVARFISISIISSSAMLSVATILTSVSAQTVGRPGTGTSSASSTRPDATLQPPSILERQYIMRSMEIEVGKPVTPEDKKLALTQIAEDYARIQVINNKMMGSVMSAKAPNYGSIADTTAEIGKRASRIRTNLPLPDDDTDDKKGPPAKSTPYKSVVDSAGLKAALLLLDARIMSFINNPIFINTSVVEVGEAARAKRDLNTIVEFSNRIAKDANRLKSWDKRP